MPLKHKLELNSSCVALSEGMSHLCHSCIGAFTFGARPTMSVLSTRGGPTVPKEALF